MRLNVQPIDFAMAFVRTVLPTPGTSSISTWPLQITAIRLKATDSALPTITFSTLLMTRCTAVAKSCTDCMLFSQNPEWVSLVFEYLWYNLTMHNDYL